MKEDIYISFLKYARQYQSKYITYRDSEKYFKDKGDIFGRKFDTHLFLVLFNSTFKTIYLTGLPSGTPNENCLMSMEAYFQLLEHEELKEARESSRKALLYARIAMGISGILALSSIYISTKQLYDNRKASIQQG